MTIAFFTKLSFQFQYYDDYYNSGSDENYEESTATTTTTTNENLFENITFTFDCMNRPMGFYADVEYKCQIFHMCDKDHARIPHICANGTSFNQEYRICDWDYNFECSESENWYYLNGLTYGSEAQTETEIDTTTEYNVLDGNYLNKANNKLNLDVSKMAHKIIQQTTENLPIARDDDTEPEFLIDIKK